MKHKTIKFFRKKNRNLCDLGFSNQFLDHESCKKKINEQDFCQIINFSSAKDTVKRLKRQVIDLKEISANHISNKVSRLQKEFLKFNNKKINTN